MSLIQKYSFISQKTRYQQQQHYRRPTLLPIPTGDPTQEPPVIHAVDNRPAWMVRGQQDEDTEIPEDANRKKIRT